MKEKLRDKAFKNFFILAHKLYNPRIVVDPKLIYEFIDTDIEEENSYLDYEKVLILKRRIGIYSKGEIVNLDVIAKEFEISPLAVSLAIKKTIDNIYRKNTENKAEIIRSHPTLQKEFMSHGIEDLEFNKKKTKEIEEKGYKKIEDILYLDEKGLRQEFRSKFFFNNEILERLNMFGYKLMGDINGTLIKQEQLSKETFELLDLYKIYTIEDLKEKLPYIKRKKLIDESIKNEIINLCETQKIQNKTSLLGLIEKKNKEQEKMKILLNAKEHIYKKIDLILDFNSDIKKELLKKVEVELINMTLAIQSEQEILNNIEEEINNIINKNKKNLKKSNKVKL